MRDVPFTQDEMVDTIRDILREIKHNRDDLGLTNDDLAERSGVPLSSINRLLASKDVPNPQFDTLARLASATNTRLDPRLGIDSETAVSHVNDPGQYLTTINRMHNDAASRLKEQIHVERREKYVLAIVLMLMISFVLGIVVHDLRSPSAGWFRQMSNYYENGFIENFMPVVTHSW